MPNKHKRKCSGNLSLFHAGEQKKTKHVELTLNFSRAGQQARGGGGILKPTSTTLYLTKCFFVLDSL